MPPVQCPILSGDLNLIMIAAATQLQKAMLAGKNPTRQHASPIWEKNRARSESSCVFKLNPGVCLSHATCVHGKLIDAKLG